MVVGALVYEVELVRECPSDRVRLCKLGVFFLNSEAFLGLVASVVPPREVFSRMFG